MIMSRSLKLRVIRYLKKSIEAYNEIDLKASVDSSVVLRGAKLEANVEVKGKSTIVDSILGRNTRLGKNNYVKKTAIKGMFSSLEGCKIYAVNIEGNVTIGKYTALWGPNLDIISGSFEVQIGSFCSIARNVSMQAFNHNMNKITTSFVGKNFFNEAWGNETISKGNIIIENDVWVGAHTVLMGGITLGNGCVVGANSVVTSNVPPYSIVGGSPARIIGKRFSDKMINKLLALRWWNWSDDKLKKHRDFFHDNLSEISLNKIIKEYQ